MTIVRTSPERNVRRTKMENTKCKHKIEESQISDEKRKKQAAIQGSYR